MTERVPETLDLPFIQDLTETGNAERFVQDHHRRLLHVPGLGWHLWDGVAWRHDATDDALDLTTNVLQRIQLELQQVEEDDRGPWQRHLATSASAKGRKAMLTLAAAHPAMKTTADALDSDPEILVLPDGQTLHLGSWRVEASRPESLCTRVAGVGFEPDAACPQWLQHIELVTQKDPLLAGYLQRWAGYTLTGHVSQQQFPFCWGEGNNGKNVLIETLVLVMGDYAMRGSSKIITAGVREHETIIADLAGVRLVFVDEAPQGRINEERVKELTGSRRIRARKMRQDTFEFDARFKLWIAGNTKPRVRDLSEGFWRRLALIPFLATIPKERRIQDYATRLVDEEGPGILNWCLHGLANYRTLGGLGEPVVVREARDEYHDEEDFVVQFLDECCEVTSQAQDWVTVNDLYGAFTLWAALAGVPVVERPHRRQFGRRVTSYGGERITGFNHRIDGVMTRGYTGLHLVKRVGASG